MRLLLDSHALLWWLIGDLKLSATARDAISDPTNDAVASVGSIYELIYKAGLGKLPSMVPKELLPMMRNAGVAALPLGVDAMLRAAELPKPHRDPWDRIFIGQALAENLTVVTRDPVFAAYGAATLW